ncbi:SCP family extracellular subfamily protein [Cardiosporidium cionae]|uniref:SCP family extracellular subfamily protein n=1 Tax=Cardiosporidium cionae TaxID=476202 RepID=A0ABQ7JEL7_9APIC|nr:SCP family extracellular subfamily protein [Cardiosporidium cionae]|eukprot:KAF8822455.1 SCP family extracellular subfamily protein [Cardiosporidium cionae]
MWIRFVLSLWLTAVSIGTIILLQLSAAGNSLPLSNVHTLLKGGSLTNESNSIRSSSSIIPKSGLSNYSAEKITGVGIVKDFNGKGSDNTRKSKFIRSGPFFMQDLQSPAIWHGALIPAQSSKYRFTWNKAGLDEKSDSNLFYNYTNAIKDAEDYWKNISTTPPSIKETKQLHRGSSLTGVCLYPSAKRNSCSKNTSALHAQQTGGNDSPSEESEPNFLKRIKDFVTNFSLFGFPNWNVAQSSPNIEGRSLLATPCSCNNRTATLGVNTSADSPAPLPHGANVAPSEGSNNVAPQRFSTFQHDLLEQQNFYRSQAGLEKLQWDETLERFITNHIITLDMKQSCLLHHSLHQQRAQVGKFTSIGENLYARWGEFFPPPGSRPATAWYNEISCYRYGTVGNSCTKNPNPLCKNVTGFDSSVMVGHFTQLMWEESTHVGCAGLRCASFKGNGNKYIVGCSYGSTKTKYGGNVAGQYPFRGAVADNLNLSRCT